jgi:hypothetical protein
MARGGNNQVNVRFHGVQDHDSFKMNQGQIMNTLETAVSRAASRR